MGKEIDLNAAQQTKKTKDSLSKGSSNKVDEIAENKRQVKKVLEVIGTILVLFVGAYLGSFIDKTETSPRSMLLIKLGLILCYVAFDTILNEDIFGILSFIKHKQKTIRLLLPSLLRIFALLFFVVIFLPSPSIGKSIKQIAEMYKPTKSVIETQTTGKPTETEKIEAYSPTFYASPTNLPAVTDTPQPTATVTPEPTPTSTLLKYRVGVFEQNSNCGEKDKTDEIIQGLRDLGFNAFKVAISTENNYKGIDVLYMPYGWSCTVYDYDLNSLWSFLESTGTGLLIGDPKPDPDRHVLFNLFPFSLDYYFMTQEKVNKSAPEFVSGLEEKYRNEIFTYTKEYDFPKGETLLSIEELKEEEGQDEELNYYNIVLFHQTPYHPSFIVSTVDKPRFVIMPGSELSVSDNAIPSELMVNIIKWLAHSSTNN